MKSRVYVASLGSATPRPASFPHLHIQVVPIYDDDDERARPSYVFSWSRGVYVYEGDEARALCDDLREAWVHSG